MSFLQEFRNFAVKGNAVDMAVGVVIGAAFANVVSSLVKDIFNPLLSILISRHLDFTSLHIVIHGNDVPFGLFFNAVLNFLIISFAVFIVIRQMNRVRIPFLSEDAPTTKSCPFCFSKIPIRATRCPNCTSELGGSSQVETTSD